MTTITIDRALLEQTLQALVRTYHYGGVIAADAECITALRAALAQQAEPVQESSAYSKDWCLRMAQIEMDAGAEFEIGPDLAQQAEPDAYGYASRLAVAIWEKHYKDAAPQWKPLDDLMGVLTQIDNMTAGLTRLAQQAEPVEPVAWSGYDLDGMVEAFSRVIESHYQRANPFQNPINMDAQMALRILRGFIPAMKAYTAPPQRKPLTVTKLLPRKLPEDNDD